MKKFLIIAAASGLMLGACSSNKTEEAAAPKPELTVEQALQQCQAGGAGQDRATLDACMKDKGFQRGGTAPAAASAPAVK